MRRVKVYRQKTEKSTIIAEAYSLTFRAVEVILFYVNTEEKLMRTGIICTGTVRSRLF